MGNRDIGGVGDIGEFTTECPFCCKVVRCKGDFLRLEQRNGLENNKIWRIPFG